ncbi:MAG: tripartite tricarboxylate transporter TctB family protein [Spirochaetes bacterium]|nr:tripartite tricarboxylate transporter TctB family protein [Spirochaetota bacterium]
MNKEFLNGLIVFGIGILAYLGSSGFERKGVAVSENPALYPQLLALVLCLFGITLVVQGVVRREASKTRKNDEHRGVQRTMFVVCSLVGYAVGIYLFGFILPSLLFMFIVPLQLGASRKTALLVSAPLSIALYVVFFLLFKVPIPHGVLFG